MSAVVVSAHAADGSIVGTTNINKVVTYSYCE